MELFIIISIILSLLSLGAVLLLLKKNSQQAQIEHMQTMVNQAFGMSAKTVAEQSRLILQGEKEIIKTDLDNKQRTIEQLVKTLQDDLKMRQEEIRGLEQDRTKKFSELVTSIENQRKLTDELTISTKQLASVLSNNQSRGEWGERIIEDILTSNGLIEGVHFAKQRAFKLEGKLRPDVSLLLPNDRVVAVDVKFPYASIQKMAATESKSEKATYLKQFNLDVKQKIDKVSEYIEPSANTLDYAILFVPNEMIFSFINQKIPDLVDYAVGKRVLLVSPFTFLIVARTVLESYRNFMIGDKLKEVVISIDDFVKEWSKFKEGFEKYGRAIETLKSSYDELSGPRTRQLDKRIQKVQQYREGGILEEKVE